MKRKSGFTLLELIIVLFIASILWAMLFPVFARARESAHKIQCLSSVTQLGAALHLYAADWGGAFPPEDNEWGPLDPYVRNRDVFRCPDDSDLVVVPPETESGNRQPVHIESSYIYRSGLSNDGRATEIVAFDRWIWHLGGRNVVFLDGHAAWFNAAAFWAFLPSAPSQVLALDPAFHALSPEQQRAVREGRQIPGKLPWQ